MGENIFIGIYEGIMELLVFYKLIILLAVLVFSIVVIILRYCFCGIRQSKVKRISDSIVDLEQLIAGGITEITLPIIFSEEASGYDLLGREGLVNVVYNSIKGYNPNHVHVIGLKGSWGSGKTTILNIVKNKIKENKDDVIVIDNLDRAEADNILFLFKLIGSVFDLSNIIYILAYDGDRIQSVFSDVNKINPKYIEKIVRQEIVIPAIPRDALTSVCLSSMEQTLIAYGVQRKDIVLYEDISRLICNNVVDLRQFKRLLNSVFITTFLYDTELYKPHLLAIEVIRFLEPVLYEEIKRNKKFFVSKDLHCSADGLYLSTINKKQFNSDGKSFFSSLFCKYKVYEELLAKMFPYVKRYRDGLDLLYNDVYPDDISKHNSIASIASAKYNDLYFSYGTNDYLKILSNVDNFIERVNLSSEEKIKKITERTIELVDGGAQTEWFERLQNKIEEIKLNVRPGVAAGICNSIKKIDTTRGFLTISADQRALVVVTKLLKGFDYDIISLLIDDCSKNYNIRLLEEIKLNCSYFIKHGDSNYEVLFEIVESKYNELCDEILAHNIDIYNDSIYQRGKIWALYRCVSEDKEEKIHNYMKNISSSNNIFKILSDMISESSGTMGYGYIMNEKYIDNLFGEKEVLRKIVGKVTPQNETEKFILNMWDRMENRMKNSIEEADYYSPVHINLLP